MALAVTLLTNKADPDVDATSFTTASMSPAANALILVCATSAIAAGTAPTISRVEHVQRGHRVGRALRINPSAATGFGSYNIASTYVAGAIGDGDVQKFTPEVFAAQGTYQVTSYAVSLPG